MSNFQSEEGPRDRKKAYPEWEFVHLTRVGPTRSGYRYYLCLTCCSTRSSMEILRNHCKTVHGVQFHTFVPTGRHSHEEFLPFPLPPDVTPSKLKYTDVTFTMLKALEPSPSIMGRRSRKDELVNIVKREENLFDVDFENVSKVVLAPAAAKQELIILEDDEDDIKAEERRSPNSITQLELRFHGLNVESQESVPKPESIGTLLPTPNLSSSPSRISGAIPAQVLSFSSNSMAETATLKDIVPGQTRVGWIGTGVMGQAMASHILAAGFQVTVFNRTRSKADGLVSKGAKYAASPLAVAEHSDVVVTILGVPTDVRQVILGEKGILNGLRKGGIFVDMTTSEPPLAREIYEAAKAQSVEAVDAPVSGGDKEAITGTLAIMAGGREETVKVLSPLFNVMGSCTYLGPPGSGQICKLANQVTIASTMVGLVEGLIYVYKAGLDISTYIRAVSGGAAGSKSMELYSSRIQSRDFAPGFYVNHFVKDLGIALNECQRMGLALPGLALAQQLSLSLQSYGEGELGIQAVTLSLERLNNIKR